MNHKIGRLLGAGATAEVFEYSDDKVVKLYLPKYPKSNAEWEFRKTKNAYDNGLPAPKVYGLIEHDGRYGVIMERIKGCLLFNILADQILNPNLTDADSITTVAFIDSIKKTARLLATMHEIKIELLESVENFLIQGVKYNMYLSEVEKQTISDIIYSLPKGTSVCHGDPNPLNIFDCGDYYKLIDWVNCMTGSPLYDIAEYTLLYRYIRFHKKQYPEIVEYIEKHCDLFIETFLSEYKSLSNIDLSALDDWTVPMLVAKLTGSGDEDYKCLVLEEMRRLLRAV